MATQGTPSKPSELSELYQALVELAHDAAGLGPGWVKAVLERVGYCSSAPCVAALERGLDVVVAEALLRGAPVEPTRARARLLAARLERVARLQPSSRS